ncbi:LysR family transcriptional regulator [Kocuria sp. NPDC057446]|uniref:LysR family transcriptional regulator n=1 Tax=Kocuria sp. NPDC057446 TaxID=3346137 RepID=UPI0036AD0615
MDLDLECTASFLILCEEGHFGQAAARLHLTSSALTKRIQRLERQIGCTLLERNHAGTASLTAAGWRFAADAAELLDCARAAQAAARAAALAAAQTTTRVTIRVGVPGRLGAGSMMSVLADIIRGLQDKIPDITLRSLGVPYGDMASALVRRHVDLLWSPSGVHHPMLVSDPLGFSTRVGVVPSSHPFARTGSADVADFARLPLLYNPAISPAYMAQGWLGDVRPIDTAELVPSAAQDVVALQREIVLGRGMAVLPMLPGMQTGAGLATVTLLGAPPTEWHAVYRGSDAEKGIADVVRLLAEITAAMHDGKRMAVLGRRGPSHHFS